MSWTDQRIDQLKALWEKGLTASQIADELGGVSRNAVIGKAHRLGLKSRPSPVKANDADKKAGPKKAAAAPAKAPAAAAAYGFPPARAFKPTRWLADGDTVALGAHTLHVRHCPGHTPGHVVFYSPEIRRAFVGDVLFAGSIGRTDFPQGNHDDLIASITERLWPMGNDTVFIPGHGPESSFGRERQSNPYVGGT